MVWETSLSILVSGLVLGSLYAMMATGLSLVWTTLGIFNFAHGVIMTLGAYIAWQVGTASNPYLLPAFAVLFTLASIVYGPWAERFYGKKDPGPCVIDEVAGYLVAVSFLPFNKDQLAVGAIAFVAFRIFDIVKPPPASWFDRQMKNGYGVVLDDVVAGLYGALALRLGLLLWTLFLEGRP